MISLFVISLLGLGTGVALLMFKSSSDCRNEGNVIMAVIFDLFGIGISAIIATVVIIMFVAVVL